MCWLRFFDRTPREFPTIIRELWKTWINNRICQDFAVAKPTESNTRTPAFVSLIFWKNMNLNYNTIPISVVSLFLPLGIIGVERRGRLEYSIICESDNFEFSLSQLVSYLNYYSCIDCRRSEMLCIGWKSPIPLHIKEPEVVCGFALDRHKKSKESNLDFVWSGFVQLKKWDTIVFYSGTRIDFLRASNMLAVILPKQPFFYVFSFFRKCRIVMSSNYPLKS